MTTIQDLYQSAREKGVRTSLDFIARHPRLKKVVLGMNFLSESFLGDISLTFPQEFQTEVVVKPREFDFIYPECSWISGRRIEEIEHIPKYGK